MEHMTDFPERCEQVTLLGKKALYAEERIPRSALPQGLYAYDLRGSDYDFNRPVTLENRVAVNHAGTIITAQPILLPEQGYIDIRRRLKFKNEPCSLREFELAAYPERLTKEERLAQADALRSTGTLLEDDDSMINGIISSGKKEPKDVRPSVAEQLHTPCKPGKPKNDHPSRGESR